LADQCGTLICCMSYYTFQFLVLSLGSICFALWFKGNRNRLAKIRNGFHIVRWSFSLRLLSAAFLIAMLTSSVYFLWLQLTTGERGLGVIWFLAIPLLALAFWGTLNFRVRNEYNETSLIAYSAFGKPRQFTLSDFTMAGPISWRGQEFSTEAGDKIYVNPYQMGGTDLIDLIQRQVKQTYLE
jgi:hypothetical protein